MERQLALLEQDAEWRLDDRTREIGRAGVARAREALRAAQQRATERAGTTTQRTDHRHAA
jgi:hypothetical protein